jgi:hypothetical protein
MSKIEVPDEMDEDEAEKILKKRAKTRSGRKKPKESTRNKAGGSDTSLAEIVVVLVVLFSLYLLVEFGVVGSF